MNPRAFWAYACGSFQEGLAFKPDLIVRVGFSMLTLLVARQLWRSLYANGISVEGMGLADLTTYVSVSILMGSFLPGNLGFAMSERVSSGDIVRDFLQPADFMTAQLARSVGTSAANLVTRLLPMVLLMVTMAPVGWPTTSSLWAAFLTSVGLAYYLAFTIHYLTALSSFMLTEIWGVEYIKSAVVSFCAGGVVPLALFPERLRLVLEYLPFRGIYALPLSILSQPEWNSQVANSLGIQTGWCVLLVLLSALATRAMRRLLTTAGG